MQETPIEPLMTANEVAEILRCSKVTVMRLRKAGTLPAVDLGGMFRYRRDDVAHLLETGIHRGEGT